MSNQFIQAVAKGNLNLVKELLPSQDSNTMQQINDFGLQVASTRGYLEMVQFFFENGANIHSEKEEALKLAITMYRKEIIKYLLSVGATIPDEEIREKIIDLGIDPDFYKVPLPHVKVAE